MKTEKQTVKEVFVLQNRVNTLVASAIAGLYEGKTGTVTLELENKVGSDYVVEVKTKRKVAKRTTTKKKVVKKTTKRKTRKTA